MGTVRRTAGVMLLVVAGMGLSIGTGQPGEYSVEPGRCGVCLPAAPGPGAAAGCAGPGFCWTKPPVVMGTTSPQDPPAPIRVVRVRVPECVKAGEDLEYRILVENCSAAAAHHVLIRNPLPANARLVRAVPEPTRRTPELQWQLGTVPGGARCEILLVLKAVGGADLTNCTRVQFEHGQCVTTRIAGFAPAPTTKEPSAGTARLVLEMTGPKQQYINIPAQYFITVRNPGTARAGKVLIANQVPAGATFVKADSRGEFADGQVAWILGDLEPGASKTVALVLRAKEAGEICFQARAEADPGLKAKAEVCTLFKGASALLIEMVDRKDPIPVGGITSYPIEVTNQGQVPVTNLRIKALIPEAMVLTQAKGPGKYQLGEKTPGGYLPLLFDSLASLEPGAKVEFEVFVRAVQAGDLRFKVEMTADQLKAGGPVHEEESTTVFPENGPAPPPGLQTRTNRQETKTPRKEKEKT